MNSFSMQVGSGTDIGGGRENQDDFLVYSKPSLGIFVGCVFDGHGREVGKIAANAARVALLKFCEERINDLVTDPASWLIAAHDHAHYFIKDSFREELELQGFEIMEDERGGFLLKRKAASQSWACVHGGSSCSIIVIKGMDMYIGNVGDSSAILCSTSSVLSSTLVEYISDSALAPSSPLLQLRGSLHSQYLTVDNSALSDTLVVTAEHSPESPYEFYRLREFRPRENDAMQPSLLVVYDSPSHEKSRCSPVFDVDAEGKVQVTNNGKYYKNVRKEWASLVSTPVTARFQDALAFTRSLGDLHLSSYGVTHRPEIHHVDLGRLFEAVTRDAESKQPPETPLLCLILATDGVWDNWTYEDANRFVLDASCVNAVKSDPSGARRVAASFMARNAVYAKRNFGAQADNATGIVLYISQNNGIPNGPDFI